MRIRPVAAEHKLSRRLFEQLADEIKSGRLAPGARLPTEHALTRAARVSRTVVREAVAALRAEGLVITRQGVGAFVSAEPTRAPFRIEPERMQSLSDILSVMELRLGVEIESAGLAAERASRAQLKAIGTALDDIERAATSGRSAVDEDLAFHRAIAEATGNPEFPRFLSKDGLPDDGGREGLESGPVKDPPMPPLVQVASLKTPSLFVVHDDGGHKLHAVGDRDGRDSRFGDQVGKMVICGSVDDHSVRAAI